MKNNMTLCDNSQPQFSQETSNVKKDGNGLVLAFDFGTKSIGVAVGQGLTGTASPLGALKAQQGTPNWEEIAKLLHEWKPICVIVGLPLNMDGTDQPLTDCARSFANRLKGRFGIRVNLHDERLSTVEARAELYSRGGYRALSKNRIDSLSAVIILESWFLSARLPYVPPP